MFLSVHCMWTSFSVLESDFIDYIWLWKIGNFRLVLTWVKKWKVILGVVNNDKIDQNMQLRINVNVFSLKDNDNQNLIFLFVISKLNKILSYRLYISFLAWFLRYFHWKQWAVMQPSSAIFDYWGYACNITRRGHACKVFMLTARDQFEPKTRFGCC